MRFSESMIVGALLIFGSLIPVGLIVLYSGLSVKLDELVFGILIEAYGIIITVFIIERVVKFRSEKQQRILVKDSFIYLKQQFLWTLSYLLPTLYDEEVNISDLEKYSKREFIELINKAVNKIRNPSNLKKITEKIISREKFNEVLNRLFYNYECCRYFLVKNLRVIEIYPSNLKLGMRGLIKSISTFLERWKKDLLPDVLPQIIPHTSDQIQLIRDILIEYAKFTEQKNIF